MRKLCKQILESNGFITNRITHLNSGAASIIYLAKTNKGSVVVIIKLRPGDSFDNAFFILKKIEQYKISPKAYFHGVFEGKPYLIEQYIPGRRLSWRKITNKEIIMMARFFNKLDSIKIGNNHYFKDKKYLLLDKLDYPKHFMHLDSKFANLVSIAENKLKNQLKNLKIRKTFVLRHADSNPYNFIVSKNKIIAVDWDWAKIGHFATDIADFFIKTNMTEKQKDLFYSKYNFKNIKKIVDLYTITSILSLITWHLQTIDLIKQKKLHKKICKNISSEKNKVKRRIKQLERILH